MKVPELDRKTMGLLVLPLGLTVALIGGIWSAVLLEDFDRLAPDFQDEIEKSRARGIELPADHSELEGRFDDASRPRTVATWMGAALLMFALVDLSLRWSGRLAAPAWFADGRIILMWVAVMALTLAVLTLAYRGHVNQGTYIHGALIGPALGLTIYGSVFFGHWLAATSFSRVGLPLRLGLSWVFALLVFWPLLSLMILVPDRTAEDLLFFTLPAMALTGIVAVALLAVVSGEQAIAPDNPLREFEAPAESAADDTAGQG